MNWYIAKIVFRIICGDGNHMPQFDEQLRLIQAEDELDALDKAAALGTREEHAFPNQHKQLVQWKFIDVSELHKLNMLTDGLEVYSRVQEEDNAGRYIDIVHKKAEYLRLSSNKTLKEAV